MANPCPQHVAVAKQILKYLKGTKDSDHKLTYRRQHSKVMITLISYADPDHAACPETCSSAQDT